IYYFKNKTNKCFIYFNKALRIWKEIKDKRQTSLTLSNLGELHMELGHLNKALQYILQADAINEKLKDKSSIVYTKGLLGDIYKKRNRYFKAQSFYKDALKIAKELHSDQDRCDLNEKLSETSELMGNIPEAYQYYKLKTQMQDSLLNAGKQKAIEELQTKYETKKKEQEIELLNNKNKLSAAVQKSQQIIIFSLIGGLLLVLFMVFIIIKRNIERRKANELLARKNDEIAHQKEELTSSIAYAQRIQTAMLPQNQIVDTSLSDYFIFFRPKDVVSGDFFWWTHFDNYTIISVSDCTGHGVPGAFMSILGVSFLREIVSKEGITHPGTILNRLRTEIITALHQKGIQGEQKDGMDMSLITINHETKTLQFAGANNPLYLISNYEFPITNDRIIKSESQSSELSTSNSKLQTPYYLYEIKPDKMPIAIYYKMISFDTTEIQLQASDQIYLFSDGYADQFGGEKEKKFKYQPFKDLLLKNANKPMQQQKEALEQTFDLWKNDYEQIDDVTVVGIKI
ncbi:MAG: SpoIIE family protein phosphatase, partial [Bacteroidales bacterium]|nr:SpoIIE family protein phosphatase [Bacteroidales bacterium]